MSSSPFQHSFWIWPDNHGWDLHNCYALFRKEFALAKKPARAPLFITADQSYQLYVNGSYVCRGPARGFQRSWPYDQVDVAPLLKRGSNVLAVRAHHPGFSNFQYLSQGYAGLLVAARWHQFTLVSDKTWKSRRQTGVQRDTVPTSLQLFCQEHIDLQEEDPAWMMPDFDDRDWAATVAEHPWNGLPWSGLEPRGIPLLEEPISLPAFSLGKSDGKCGESYRAVRDVTRLRYSEGLSHRPDQSSPETILVEPSNPGGYRSYLLDFGKTVVGSIGFQIENAAGGEVIDTLHGETVDQETLAIHFEPDKVCRMAFGTRLICRPGEQTHIFYHPFGFRYLVLTVRDSRQELRIQPFLRTTLYPLVRKGLFHSSDSKLNQIWETCAWTQRICSLDAFVDTPWREQAQWWGDARVQAKNTFFLAGDTRLFRRGIQQIAMQTTPDGVTYGHAPTMAHSCVLPDFTLIWMLTLWDYYWQTGSLEPFLANQKVLTHALAYFKEHTDRKTGLVGYDQRYWLFLDWTGLFKDGYSTVYNLWLLIALEKMAALYRLTGQPDHANGLAKRAGKLRRSLEVLIRDDGLLSDGLTFNRNLVESASIHAQTLAIMAGFHEAKNEMRIQQVLLPFINGEQVPPVTPSSYWITHVFEVLTEAGHGREVVEFIREKWQAMALHGSTWENFQPRVADESFSHAWSAHPLYHLMQTLGGIRQTKAAWKQITFQPTFFGNGCSTTVPTPHGEIHSSWKRTSRGFSVKLALPKGISAKVVLPEGKSAKVHGTNTWTLTGDL